MRTKSTKAKRKYTKSYGGLAPDKYLNGTQVKRLHSYCKRKARKAQLNHCRRAVVNEMLIDLLLNTGLRPSELCQLQMRDLPHCHGKPVVNVRKGKGCIQRSVQISKKLTRRITRFVKQYRPNSKPRSPLFINERDGPLSYNSLLSKIKKIGTAVGLWVTPKKFRHTYAMEYYKRYRDIFALQSQLGHADPKTTMIYARTTSEQIREQVEKFDL